jgi:hypothetical protein
MNNLSETALEGKEALTALTGCKQPCQSIAYNVIPLATWNMKYNRDLRAQGTLLYEMPSNPKGKNFVSKIHCYCPQNTMEIICRR